MSIKAIAARSEIKKYLDDEKARVDELQYQLQIMSEKLKEAEDERLEV